MECALRKFSIPTVILTFLIGFTLSSEFIPLDYKSGLMFRELSHARPYFNRFKLIYRTNLTEFFLIKGEMEKCIDLIDRMCPDSFTNCTEHKFYLNKVTQLVDKAEEEISIYQVQETKPKNRRKRFIASINRFVDWIANFLDFRSAEEYDEKFKEIYQDSKEIQKLNFATTTFARDNVMLNREKFSQLTNGYNKIQLRYLRGENDHDKEAFVNRIMHLFNTWFLEHKFLSEQITKHLEGAIFGKFSQLIPIDQLTKDLRRLETLLPSGQKLPIDINEENALNIFKFSSTRASLFGDKMLIEISIPRVELDVYRAYEIIPIPFRFSNTSAIILPSMTYFLFNHDNMDYIPITKLEFDSAITNSANQRIINPHDNIYHNFNESCEIKIFMNASVTESSNYCNIKIIPSSNLFIPLNHISEYYLSIYSSVIIHEFCHGQTMTKQIFTNSGILKLTENCRIRSKGITIKPRISTEVHSENAISLTTNFDDMINTPIFEQLNNLSKTIEQREKYVPQIMIKDSVEDFNILTRRADELIEQAQIERELREPGNTEPKFSIWSFCTVFIVPIFNITIVILMIVLRSRFKQRRAATVIISNNQPTNKGIDQI